MREVLQLRVVLVKSRRRALRWVVLKEHVKELIDQFVVVSLGLCGGDGRNYKQGRKKQKKRKSLDHEIFPKNH